MVESSFIIIPNSRDMFHTTQANLSTVATALITGVVLTAIIFISNPLFASAASYAYVSSTGEVKSVVANDWQSAINTAPGIHMNSGVLLLDSAADHSIVGDDVSGY